MQYFNARDNRDTADAVTVLALMTGLTVVLADYAPDSSLSEVGLLVSSLAVLTAVVGLAMRSKENAQMRDHEPDLEAVGGTD
jgi:hypothetical protein